MSLWLTSEIALSLNEDHSPFSVVAIKPFLLILSRNWSIFFLSKLLIGLKFWLLGPELTYSYVPDKKYKIFVKDFFVSEVSEWLFLLLEPTHDSTLHPVCSIFSVVTLVWNKRSHNLSPEKASWLSWGTSGWVISGETSLNPVELRIGFMWRKVDSLKGLGYNF